MLKEKERTLYRQNSVLDLLKSSSVTRASPPVLLDIADDDKQIRIRQQFKTKCILFSLSFVCAF
jgi:hypothetical protein